MINILILLSLIYIAIIVTFAVNELGVLPYSTEYFNRKLRQFAVESDAGDYTDKEIVKKGEWIRKGLKLNKTDFVSQVQHQAYMLSPK